MMKYIVRLMNKSEFLITGDEYKKLAGNKSKGLVYVPSARRSINMRRIEEILEDETSYLKMLALPEPKRNQAEIDKVLKQTREYLEETLWSKK